MVNISLRVLSKPDTEELANIYKARNGARSGMLFRLCLSVTRAQRSPRD